MYFSYQVKYICLPISFHIKKQFSFVWDVASKFIDHQLINWNTIDKKLIN